MVGEEESRWIDPKTVITIGGMVVAVTIFVMRLEKAVDRVANTADKHAAVLSNDMKHLSFAIDGLKIEIEAGREVREELQKDVLILRGRVEALEGRP